MSFEKPSWVETLAVALIVSSFAFLAFFPRLNPRLRSPRDEAEYVAGARGVEPKVQDRGVQNHADRIRDFGETAFVVD